MCLGDHDRRRSVTDDPSTQWRQRGRCRSAPSDSSAVARVVTEYLLSPGVQTCQSITDDNLVWNGTRGIDRFRDPAVNALRIGGSRLRFVVSFSRGCCRTADLQPCHWTTPPQIERNGRAPPTQGTFLCDTELETNVVVRSDTSDPPKAFNRVEKMIVVTAMFRPTVHVRWSTGPKRDNRFPRTSRDTVIGARELENTDKKNHSFLAEIIGPSPFRRVGPADTPTSGVRDAHVYLRGIIRILRRTVHPRIPESDVGKLGSRNSRGSGREGMATG